mmetsp:Transcript_80806/g.161138  ORF Transcript_80806/g.161138 Transcript_80806/m.161138 type:complete len:87 (+) Transcript_80806:301-561(+)
MAAAAMGRVAVGGAANLRLRGLRASSRRAHQACSLASRRKTEKNHAFHVSDNYYEAVPEEKQKSMRFMFPTIISKSKRISLNCKQR